MKKTSVFMLTVFLFAAITTAGCQSQALSSAGQAHVSQVQAGSVGEVLSADDQAFLAAFQQSLASALKIITEFNLILAEAERQDEAEEALEYIETAKREILYVWNSIHNEYKPDQADLQAVKQTYEAALMAYKKGLSLQAEGLARLDGIKAVEGQQMAQKAENELRMLQKNRKIGGFPD